MLDCTLHTRADIGPNSGADLIGITIVLMHCTYHSATVPTGSPTCARCADNRTRR